MVGRIGRVETVGTIFIERQTVYRTIQAVSRTGTSIHIGRGHAANHHGTVFGGRVGCSDGYRVVVGAVDRHLDALFGAISTDNSKAFRLRGTGCQRVKGAVGRKAPIAISINGEGAQHASRCRRGKIGGIANVHFVCNHSAADGH